ncbi:interferon-induced protein with tetratricopeptide repeats 5 [Microcaecilia unicolor]|uniref:Interferon-induced protein with tetratricopeptide repeats 5-like n=1 Tax=Microcaecilia unicolor TaxID=1415580 RepID=A0A6P7XTZ0_9AMPH|nr:interferon-induced protein with tetratricopeptide repeats 5-like [Microcaecilia unicolor]
MGEISNNSLKTKLLQLECHFTWGLMKDDSDLNELEDTLHDQIEFIFPNCRSMVYNLLAYVNHLNGNNDEALANLQKAEELIQEVQDDDINKKIITTYGNYAWIYYDMNKLEDTNTYLGKVEGICKMLSSTSRYKVLLSDVYGEKGWALLKFCGQYYEKAKECFQKAIENDPEDPEWNSGYATVVYRLEGFNNKKFDPEDCKSLELLRRAIKLNPQDTVVMALLGLKLQDMHQSEEGEKYIREALQKTPNLPYLLRYAAKFYRRRGLVDEAIKLLKKAVSFTPRSGFLHHQLGICYKRKMIELRKAARSSKSRYSARDDFSEQIQELIRCALYHFEFVVEQKTTFVYAKIDLANMYVEANQHDKAEEMFQKVFRMKKLTDAEKQQIYLNYGRYQVYHKRSEPEAIRYYTAGLRLQKKSTERDLCQTALQKLAEKKIQRNGADASGYGILGLIHQLNGEKKEAIECYERALELDPDNEEYLSGLCDMRLSI